MKQIILKFAAWILFIFSTLLSLGILSTVFFFPIWIKDVNLSKMIVLDFVIILIAVVVFVIGFGILEFLFSLIKMEKEVAEIEHIMPKIEEKIGLKIDAEHKDHFERPQAEIKVVDKEKGKI